MLFNSIKGVPWEPQLGVEREVVNRVRNPRETSSTADSRGTVAKKSLHQAISGIGEVRAHGQVYRVPACHRQRGTTTRRRVRHACLPLRGRVCCRIVRYQITSPPVLAAGEMVTDQMMIFTVL